MDSDLTYKSIRQEIMDMRKCQFNLMAATLTVSAAILTYLGTSDLVPFGYVIPIVMNDLALLIILEKSLSIHRKAGYLRLIEGDEVQSPKWEIHLNLFRSVSGAASGAEKLRRHVYALTLAGALILINVFCGILHFWGPSAQALRVQGDFSKAAEVYASVHSVVGTMVVVGGVLTYWALWQMTRGRYTAEAIDERWRRAIGLRAEVCDSNVQGP